MKQLFNFGLLYFQNKKNLGILNGKWQICLYNLQQFSLANVVFSQNFS